MNKNKLIIKGSDCYNQEFFISRTFDNNFQIGISENTGTNSVVLTKEEYDLVVKFINENILK